MFKFFFKIKKHHKKIALYITMVLYILNLDLTYIYMNYCPILNKYENIICIKMN